MHAANNRNSANSAPEPQVPTEPSYVKPSDMEMLSSIHRSSVEIFAARPGFGGTPDGIFFRSERGILSADLRQGC